MLIFHSLFYAFVLVFPTFLILSRKNKSKKRQKALLDKAIAKGNVVTANLIEKSSLLKDVPGIPGYTYRLVYEYKYKGKKYKYLYWSLTPTQTLTLYFLNNPRKANVRGGINSEKINWPVVFIIVSAIIYFLLFMVKKGV